MRKNTHLNFWNVLFRNTYICISVYGSMDNLICPWLKNTKGPTEINENKLDEKSSFHMENGSSSNHIQNIPKIRNTFIHFKSR